MSSPRPCTYLPLLGSRTWQVNNRLANAPTNQRRRLSLETTRGAPHCPACLPACARQLTYNRLHHQQHFKTIPTLACKVHCQWCLTRVYVSIKIKYTPPAHTHTHTHYAHQSASFSHPQDPLPLHPLYTPRGLCLFSTGPTICRGYLTSARVRPAHRSRLHIMRHGQTTGGYQPGRIL